MNWAAILALLPLAIGPLPQEDRILTIGTCLGVEITIPLGENEGKRENNCSPNGCHAGTCREKSHKPKQPAV